MFFFSFTCVLFVSFENMFVRRILDGGVLKRKYLILKFHVSWNFPKKKKRKKKEVLIKSLFFNFFLFFINER